MTFADFVPLANTTLRAPQTAARFIIGLRFKREVLWTTLALIAALNSFLIQAMVATAPADMQAQFPGYFDNPLALFVLLAGTLVIFVHALYWAALSVSGQGRFDDLLALIVWLQLLRTAAQGLIFVVGLALPALAMLLTLVATAWAFWILLHFVAEAMALSGLGQSAMVLLIAVFGMFIGVGILLALMAMLAQGVLGNV